MHHNPKTGDEAMRNCNQKGFQEVNACNNQPNKETAGKYALKFKGHHAMPVTPDMQSSPDTSVSISSRSTAGSSGYDADGEMSSRSEIATNTVKRVGIKQRKTIQQRNHPTTRGKNDGTSTATSGDSDSTPEDKPTT